MSSFCPPSVLSYVSVHCCAACRSADWRKEQVLWLGKEGKGRKQVLDSPPWHKLPVWSWLSHLILAEAVMAELWQRSRGPNLWWRWDARDWQTVKHQCHASSHLMLLNSICGTLLSRKKYHSSRDYSHQIPLQWRCTRVWRWVLLLLWQKLLWSMNIETLSRRLAAARMQSLKFSEGAADSWALPPRQQGPWMSMCVRGTIRHNTTSSLATTPLLAFPELSHTRVKKP